MSDFYQLRNGARTTDLKSEPQNRSLRRAQAGWNIEYSAGGGSKDGIALGLHRFFSDEGSLNLNEKVMSAED